MIQTDPYCSPAFYVYIISPFGRDMMGHFGIPWDICGHCGTSRDIWGHHQPGGQKWTPSVFVVNYFGMRPEVPPSGQHSPRHLSNRPAKTTDKSSLAAMHIERPARFCLAGRCWFTCVQRLVCPLQCVSVSLSGSL